MPELKILSEIKIPADLKVLCDRKNLPGMPERMILTELVREL